MPHCLRTKSENLPGGSDIEANYYKEMEWFFKPGRNPRNKKNYEGI